VDARKIGGHFGERVGKAEAGHDDRAVAGLGEFAHSLLTLGFGLDLEVVEGAAGILGPLRRAIERRFIE
jgi:hypothetical protein